MCRHCAENAGSPLFRSLLKERLPGSWNGVRKSLERRVGVPPLLAVFELAAISVPAGGVICRASVATFATVFTVPSLAALLFVFARHAGAAQASKIIGREARTSASPRSPDPCWIARIGPRRSALLVCLRENIQQAV